MLGDSKLFSLHLFNKEKSNGKDGGRGGGVFLNYLREVWVSEKARLL